MKKLLLATTLAFAATAANASTITLAGAGTTGNFASPFNPTTPGSGPYSFTSGLTGTLTALISGTFTATYLGKEASHNNTYTLSIGGATLDNNGPVGSSISAFIPAGVVGFTFKDVTFNSSIANGQANTAAKGIAFFLDPLKKYDFLIGFNDAFAGAADFDDMLIGAKFAPTPIPAALPLLGSAIGVFGLARRNKKVTLA